MFVLYAGIVHVQCYRGWYVETGNVNTILGKLHKLKYAILTRHNNYLGHTEWWDKHAHADIFVAHCGFQVQY